MKNVIVLILHGVEAGHLSSDYADKFVRMITDELPKDQKDRFIFIPLNWGAIGQGRQEKAYRSMESELPKRFLR